MFEHIRNLLSRLFAGLYDAGTDSWFDGRLYDTREDQIVHRVLQRSDYENCDNVPAKKRVRRKKHG